MCTQLRFHHSARCMTLKSRDFLTGFHKRKLAKKEESKKKAQAREKEERLEARREVHTSCCCAVKGFRSRADITCLALSAAAYAHRAGCPERRKNRRGIRWRRRTACVPSSIQTTAGQLTLSRKLFFENRSSRRIRLGLGGMGRHRPPVVLVVVRGPSRWSRRRTRVCVFGRGTARDRHGRGGL